MMSIKQVLVFCQTIFVKINLTLFVYARKHVVFKNVLSPTLDCELHEGSDYV